MAKNIDAKGNIQPEEYLYLYWFCKCVKNMDLEKYVDDFHPTQSLIEEYNHFVNNWTKKFTANRSRFEKPIDWDIDRPKTPYFKEKLNTGHRFEVWVEEEFKKEGIDLGIFYDDNGQYSGENKYGIEIKNDEVLKDTGNVYIEYQERLHNNTPWVNSGILKQDNTKYVLIGSPEEYYIISKDVLVNEYTKLKRIDKNHKGFWKDSCRFVKENANGTSLGFIIKRDKVKTLATAVSIKDFVKQSETK